MAHIQANKHCAQIVHFLRELERVKITAHLRVDLPQDVARLRQVELERILSGDHLGGHPEFLHQLFVASVVSLIAQKDYNNARMSELFISCHVVGELSFYLIKAFFLLSLNEVRVSDLDSELLGATLKGINDVVCEVIHLTIIDEDPLFEAQVHCFLNGQTTQFIFVTFYDLVAFD